MQIALAYLQARASGSTRDEESGSLRRIDEASAVAPQAVGYPLRTPDPASPNTVTIWTSQQTSYPASFLCVDTVTDPTQNSPFRELYRFVKFSASASWTVNYETVLGPWTQGAPPGVPPVAFDSSGYVQVVTPDHYDQFLTSPAKVATDYASYLAARNSADDHEFAPGGYTSGQIDQDRKEITLNAQSPSHDTVTITRTPTGAPADAYMLQGDGALVLVEIMETRRITAGQGTIIKPPDALYNGTVPASPGSYRDLTYNIIYLDAFIVPPKGSSAKVMLVGIFRGGVSTTGTPAGP
jgi:hypothetical protein